jgi:hypothetical protein
MGERTMAEKNSEGTPKQRGLSPEQKKQLADMAQRHKEAQREYTKAIGLLWSAQLDLAVAIQSGSLMREVMARPLSFFDDCNCCSEIVIVNRK